ncbi:MAG: IPT/TIG domain-containing protein [Cyclobacteriaceae bacterium]|nr:IPT/TIG domain-containing protein [Cyclobacteriaceae bacterium]
MVKNTFKILALLLLLTMCEQKEKIQPRPYPRVRTFSVTEITPKGAVFHGEVIYTPSPITDYGFVWSYNPNLNPYESEVLSLGSLASAGKFEARIERSLKAGYTYYVRAYAKTSNYEVYGDPITFLSLGSDAPVITKLDPPTGRTSDTIRVVGKNFSKITSNIQVRFDTLKSKLVEATDSVLRVIVPPTLSIPSAFVSVSVFGNVGTSPMPFELIAPTLTSVAPSLISACDTLHITGSDFSTLPDNLKVTLGGTSCRILSVSSTDVYALVPSFTPGSSAVIVELTSSNIKVAYPNTITYKAPSVSALSSPSIITYLDTLVFTGVNLPTCGLLSVTLGTFSAATVSRTKTTIKAIVPQTLTNTNNTVKLDFDNGAYVYETNFSLATPVISSISPSTSTFFEEITITGNYFHPVAASNIVYVGNYRAITFSGNRTKIRAYITMNSVLCSENNSCNQVSVVVGDRVAESTAFSLRKPNINSISPLTLSIAEPLTIDGNDFAPGPQNYLYLNGYRLLASTYTPTSLTFNMTRNALSNNNPYFSSSYTASIWVSVGNADPSRPNSLYSNSINVPVNYEGPWTLMNAYSGNYHSGSLTFSINDKAYLVGGLNELNALSAEVWEYDSSQDSWRQLADFPGGARMKGMGFSHNGLGYVGLGQGNLGLYHDVWEFNPATESWTQMSDFTGGARKSPFAFTTGDYTYVGGSDAEVSGALDFWQFDPATKTWNRKADLPKPFYKGIAFNTNTGGYVVELPQVWNYNPATNSWTEVANPGISAGGIGVYHATGLGTWDRGFLFSEVSNQFFMYDPYQNNWTFMVSINPTALGRTGFTIGRFFYYGLGRSGGFPNTEFYKLDMANYPY